MLKKITTSFFLFIAMLSLSQEKEFTNTLEKISSEIKTVQNSKSTFNQVVTSEQLGVILLHTTETTNKGKIIETVYQLNFSDIDVNTIRPITIKEVIMVQLLVKNNQKMIQKTVDNEKISFENKVFVLADNIDNARVLTDLLKKISPISNKITENRLSLSGYQDRLDWLGKNIVDVQLIDATYTQSFLASENNIGNVVFSTTISKKKSNKTKKSEFNLLNINPNTIFFKSKGNEFILSFETKRKLKTIKNFEDEVQKKYTNNLKINCIDVENARDLQKVLKDIIPLAQKRFDKTIPKVKSIEEGIEIVNKKIETVNTGQKTTQQSFSKSFITSFTKKVSDLKKEQDFIFDFNFIDLNKDDIEIEIKGIEILLVLKTKIKNKFIKKQEDNELQNYINKIEIVCNSIEDAYRLKSVFKQIVSLTENQKKEMVQISTIDKGFEVLKKNILGVNIDKYSYEQSVELNKENDAKIVKFRSIKISEKKSEETIQEFNLFDINPKSIEISVSGKKVMVKFYTNYQEKIIKTYKNGVIKSYTNKAIIFCTDIENARKIKNYLKELTNLK